MDHQGRGGDHYQQEDLRDDTFDQLVDCTDLIGPAREQVNGSSRLLPDDEEQNRGRARRTVPNTGLPSDRHDDEKRKLETALNSIINVQEQIDQLFSQRTARKRSRSPDVDQ